MKEAKIIATDIVFDDDLPELIMQNCDAWELIQYAAMIDSPNMLKDKESLKEICNRLIDDNYTNVITRW